MPVEPASSHATAWCFHNKFSPEVPLPVSSPPPLSQGITTRVERLRKRHNPIAVKVSGDVEGWILVYLDGANVMKLFATTGRVPVSISGIRVDAYGSSTPHLYSPSHMCLLHPEYVARWNAAESAARKAVASDPNAICALLRGKVVDLRRRGAHTVADRVEEQVRQLERGRMLTADEFENVLLLTQNGMSLPDALVRIQDAQRIKPNDSGELPTNNDFDVATSLIEAGESYIVRGQPLLGAEYLSAAWSLIGTENYDELLSRTRKALDSSGPSSASETIKPTTIGSILHLAHPQD